MLSLAQQEDAADDDDIENLGDKKKLGKKRSKKPVSIEYEYEREDMVPVKQEKIALKSESKKKRKVAE